MKANQRATLRGFLAKRWVFKLLCIVVAVPIVIVAFAPIMSLAARAHS